MDLASLGVSIAKIGLPLLGAVLPIPGGAAIGAALASHIGASSADPGDILASLTQSAEAMQKAKEFELTHQETMLQMKLSAEQANYATEVDDRKDARAKLASNEALWWIAVLVLITFAAVMSAVLFGSWRLLEGGITIKDVSVVAAISGLVGSIVGYVAANAQTVINFLFGGSMGSDRHTAALSAGVQASITALGGRQASVYQPAPPSGLTPSAGIKPAAPADDPDPAADDDGDGAPRVASQGPVYTGGS